MFGTKRQAITKHLKNIFLSKELDENSVCSILELTAGDGKIYKTKTYNLDAILSVGYRVNSIYATQFRRWANQVLKEYLLKGYCINNRIDKLEKTVAEHSTKIDFFVRNALPPIEGVFYQGQIFDAYVFASDLIKSAKTSIILIDNYIDETILTLLGKRRQGVAVVVYTQSISKQLNLDIEKYNSQYEIISVKTIKSVHDRFLILDDDVYHIGASLKDLGKKLFAFSKMNINKELLFE